MCDCVINVKSFLTFSIRFVPDKEFSGTDRTSRREGPVQFEKNEEDPFGLDQQLNQLLTKAKRATKRPVDEPRSSSSRDYDRSKKRRE